MSNVIPARIQNRRGKRQDLPQPLLPGELGFCTDTRELFIGADPSDVTSVTSPIIHVYGEYVGATSDYTQTPIYTNTYHSVTKSILDAHLVQVDLSGTDTYPDITTDTTTTVSSELMIVVEENGSQRAYIAYKDPQIVLPTYPTVTNGTSRFLGTVKHFTGRELNLSGITIAGKQYTVMDTSAITKLINWVFDNSVTFQDAVGTGRGLVTMSQNVEITTESSKNYDTELPVLKRTLVDNVTDQSTGIWLSIDDSDSYNIEYSIKNDRYNRKGKLSIVVIGSTFDIVDDFQETSTLMTISENIVLSAEFVPGSNSKVLDIVYTASGLPVGDETNFSVNITRWNSF